MLHVWLIPRASCSQLHTSFFLSKNGAMLFCCCCAWHKVGQPPRDSLKDQDGMYLLVALVILDNLQNLTCLSTTLLAYQAFYTRYPMQNFLLTQILQCSMSLVVTMKRPSKKSLKTAWRHSDMGEILSSLTIRRTCINIMSDKIREKQKATWFSWWRKLELHRWKLHGQSPKHEWD